MSFTATHHDSPGSTGTTESVVDLVDRFGPTPVTLLAVWSHPDDETFLAGGLIAEVIRRGGVVVNVSATAGEHGTDDPVNLPPNVLAELRRGELREALAELGAGPAIELGFGDGACDLVPDRLATELIGALIGQVRPDVVLGFGPDGVTGHPDHRAVARWTRRAVADHRDHIPLVTTAAATAWPEPCIDRLRSIDAFWPGFPERPSTGSEIATVVPDDLLDRKLAALDRHASQMAPVKRALGPEGFRAVAANEAYRAANPAAARRLHAGRASRHTPRVVPLAA